MLVETVAALALTGLLMAFVLPLVPTGTGSVRFEALVAAASALLRDARSQAIERAKPVSVAFDARARQLRSGGRGLAIPDDVSLAMVAGGRCPADGPDGAAIVFRPNGTNCGGVLRFARRGRMLRVRVDWVDGRIDVARGG